MPISGDDDLGGQFLQVLIAMTSSNNERCCGRTATWETSFHKFRVSSKDNGPHATLVERVAQALPQRKVVYTLHHDKTKRPYSWFWVVLTYRPLPHVAAPADRPDGACGSDRDLH